MSISRFPSTTFPTGWFLVGQSNEFPREKVISKKIFDQEIVIFRTASGVISVIDAYCPHLGAHLGHGGRVSGESIRCPFHGFCFNTEGDCVTTNRSTTPHKKLSIKKWTLHETSGLIFVWYDGENETPTWKMPNFITDESHPKHYQSWVLRAHPQEILENGLDSMHFDALHGFKEIETLEKIFIEDHFFRTKYAYLCEGLSDSLARQEVEISMYGMGYVLANVNNSQYGLDMQTLVMVTPIDKESINFTVVLNISQMNFQKIYPILKCIPSKWLNAIVSKFIFKRGIEVILEDFAIWENKKYIENPSFIPADVIKFRQWAQQFYKKCEKSEKKISQLTENHASLTHICE